MRKKLNRSKKTKPVHNLKNAFPMMEFWIILTKYKPEFTIFLAPSAPLSVNDYHWFSLGHKKITQKVPIPSGYDSSIHVLDRRSFFHQPIITSIQFSVTLVSSSAASLAWRVASSRSQCDFLYNVIQIVSEKNMYSPILKFSKNHD